MRREVGLVVSRRTAAHRDRAQRVKKSGTMVQGYVPAMRGLWLSRLGSQVLSTSIYPEPHLVNQV